MNIGQLFLCGSKSATHIFDTIRVSKKFSGYHVGLVTPNMQSIEDFDIVVCTGLVALFNVVDYLCEDTVVVVCDGPIQLATLVDGIPLDYVVQRSYQFVYQPVDYQKLLSAVKSPKGATLTVTSFDYLGLVTADTASDSKFLTALNNVQSAFDVQSREKLRRLLVGYLITNDHEGKDITQFLHTECRSQTHRAHAKELLAALKADGPMFRKAFTMMAKNKKLQAASVAKKVNLTVFEVRYMARMLADNQRSAEKTNQYSKMIEGKSNATATAH